jgi:hypothetical protein
VLVKSFPPAIGFGFGLFWACAGAAATDSAAIAATAAPARNAIRVLCFTVHLPVASDSVAAAAPYTQAARSRARIAD